MSRNCVRIPWENLLKGFAKELLAASAAAVVAALAADFIGCAVLRLVVGLAVGALVYSGALLLLKSTGLRFVMSSFRSRFQRK